MFQLGSVCYLHYWFQRFFGTIRQAGGQNDHPATPTFLQLYKLLSLYSILKPPKSGNCTVINDRPAAPLITVSRLKEIYSTGSTSPAVFEELKKELDTLVNHEEWEFDDVVEHDYAYAPVIDCVVYYLTGYLSSKIVRHSKCDKCKTSLSTSAVFSQRPEAELVNLKTKGWLIHPNFFFFCFIREVENTFEMFSSSPNVLELTVSHVAKNKHLSFPCSAHKHEIVMFVVRYYLTMRMRQFSQKKSAESDKINKLKKKLAKFAKT